MHLGVLLIYLCELKLQSLKYLPNMLALCSGADLGRGEAKGAVASHFLSKLLLGQ